ncbi:pantothenate kinase, type III [Eggerthia catenaformis OT 569 = DSM 20559]|uniref:Type III pantothenate kinase n=1 Tax=Eggerthia catenaformis OT 569 = DSM 20559 TaxID=999415 RepID=M2ND34_9FIRM|nr:type III pantothenate kinase [Eggerthia catenaformis]EMD16098.1 pantothenate kinase, type III [Eggerthia catenaformis OT 569 = DSM 20559]OUC51775.1 type III pantothenate kinase [Eggerthia catenaformis]
MLLAVDIGNTNITIGIYKDNQLINNFRLTTRLQRTSDEYGIMITSFMNANHYPTNELHDVIISSVVPKINYSFSSSIIKYFHIHPIFIGPGIKTGISIRIDHPSSLGADRLVDAAGAYFTYGGPCLVIDFGTATTYDVITDKGEFIGGATAAGIGITANALSSMAAQLPEIEISRPEHLISKNTISSMQAGIVYGYIGQTEYIIDKIKKEYGENLKVISTGGLGKIIANQTDRIDIYDNNLTFKGLKIIYDKNKNLLKK